MGARGDMRNTQRPDGPPATPPPSPYPLRVEQAIQHATAPGVASTAAAQQPPDRRIPLADATGPTIWVRLARGRRGGMVNRIARTVRTHEIVEVPADVGAWLIEQGDFVEVTAGATKPTTPAKQPSAAKPAGD